MDDSRSNVSDSFQARKRVWQNPDSFATTLLALFIDTYGTEGLDWDPMTIQSEIEQDFGVKVERSVFDRLMAGIAILTTDSFYKSLPDFIALCNVLAGDSYDPAVFDPADSAEIAWGMSEGMLISPPEDDEENPFSEDIVNYIAQTLKSEGLLTPPDVLKVGMKEEFSKILEKVKYDYSDDPEMFNAVYDMQSSRTGDINKTIKGMLKSLLEQMKDLPLNNGDPTEAVARMIKGMT
jgi:hypothetical protein